ncbi:MAG: hypothetical protein P1V51_16710 [Deltaproteobacteria bacterium]|nr:hypothetical protein [Deltaproteobacteria bacterium]
MAKNKHTFAKRQRELKKMQKAADKRERRQKLTAAAKRPGDPADAAEEETPEPITEPGAPLPSED